VTGETRSPPSNRPRESSKSHPSSGKCVPSSRKRHISSSSVDTSSWKRHLSSSPSGFFSSSCGSSTSNGGETSKNRHTFVSICRTSCRSGDNSSSKRRPSCAPCDRDGPKTYETRSPRRWPGANRQHSNWNRHNSNWNRRRAILTGRCLCPPTRKVSLSVGRFPRYRPPVRAHRPQA